MTGRKVIALLLIAAALFLSGCDTSGTPAAPTNPATDQTAPAETTPATEDYPVIGTPMPETTEGYPELQPLEIYPTP